MVFILTDDQLNGTLSEMPKTQKLLVEKGANFENAYVATPLCCPSRVTFLRGQYSHNHGVVDNGEPLGGLHRFKGLGLDEDNIVTRPHDSGYATGLFGKLLGDDGAEGDPMGFDRYFGFTGLMNEADTFTDLASLSTRLVTSSCFR